MLTCDTLIRNATLYDGSNANAEITDVALRADRILAIGPSLDIPASETINAEGLALAPGFIDTHTHDDTSVIRNPAMLPKISQESPPSSPATAASPLHPSRLPAHRPTP